MKRLYFMGVMGIVLATVIGCAGRPVPQKVTPLAEKVRLPLANLQEEVVKAARSLVGSACPETEAPPADFDCKRYIPDLYQKAAGVRLPLTADALVKSGLPVSKENLRPGDIVYFMTDSRLTFDPGIYIGGGDFVHAPPAGGEVDIQKMDHDYWRIRFVGARRVLRGAEQG